MQDGSSHSKTKKKLSMRREFSRTGRLTAKLLRSYLELRKSQPTWTKIESIGKHLRKCGNFTTSVQREERSVFYEETRVSLTKTQCRDTRKLSKV